MDSNFEDNLDRQQARVRKNLDDIKAKREQRHAKLGEKSKSFEYQTKPKPNAMFQEYDDATFPEERRNDTRKGFRNLWGNSEVGVAMKNNIRPISPLDEKEVWVDGAKWVEIPKHRFDDGRHNKAVNSGRALCLGNEADLLVVGGGLTGQCITYSYQHWLDQKGAFSSDVSQVIDAKKGGWRSDF